MTGFRGSRRSTSRLAVSLLVVGFASTMLFGLVGTSVAGAGAPAPSFYLDLGASASVGVQPTLEHPKGAPTAQGYANDLVAYEATQGETFDLTQSGCSGEKTNSMIAGGDGCFSSPDSQLYEARTFLAQHYHDAGIVTLDIGFNNVRTCFETVLVVQSCVVNQLQRVSQQLPLILAGLKGAAGPLVSFVGLGHYDPFLANALLSSAGTQYAQATSVAVNRLNSVLQGAYSGAGIPMARVGGAFNNGDVALVRLSGEGLVQTNVASVCEMTWMCQAAPYGPNIHPNDTGYATIAAAIEDALPSPS